MFRASLCPRCEGYCSTESNSNIHSAHSSRPSSTQPQPSQPVQNIICGSAHTLVLLMVGIMMSETCWDKCSIINIGLVASCWFLSLHLSRKVTFTVHTARVPAPHNHSHHNQCRTPYAAVHNLFLLMVGIMIPETCWDKSLIINIRLVASCWFLCLHPTFMMHGHKSLKCRKQFITNRLACLKTRLLSLRTANPGSALSSEVLMFPRSVYESYSRHL